MTGAVDEILQEMRKVASLLATARRLVGSGALVDLSVLDDKVERLCQRAQALGREQGRALVPAFENLIAQLDELARELEARRQHGE